MRYRVIKYRAGQIYISAGVKARIIEYKGNGTFYLGCRIRPPFMPSEIVLSVIFLALGRGVKLAPLEGAVFSTFMFNYTYTQLASSSPLYILYIIYYSH
jgi:hypothetical protein